MSDAGEPITAAARAAVERLLDIEPTVPQTNPLWDNNQVQFPRLLAEIAATVDLTEEQWTGLLDSMNLEDDDLRELFDRAQSAWERYKVASGPMVMSDWHEFLAWKLNRRVFGDHAYCKDRLGRVPTVEQVDAAIAGVINDAVGDMAEGLDQYEAQIWQALEVDR